MQTFLVSNGRRITAADVDGIRRLIDAHPSWTRTRLSVELCKAWNWYALNGQVKDMVCRTFLRKLHQRQLIALPPPVHSGNNQFRHRNIPEILHSTADIRDELHSLLPLRLHQTSADPDSRKLFRCLLDRYHYLGYKGSPGESLAYLVFDRRQRPLAALLFAAAAWKIAPRDALIGWNAATRERHLIYLTNNVRFLILPWVEVRNLATYVLSRALRRLSRDWRQRYGHPLYLVETFVDVSRFDGASYRAANWIKVGQTQGRSRQDRHHQKTVPVKDIYLYPLHRGWKQKLNQESPPSAGIAAR